MYCLFCLLLQLKTIYPLHHQFSSSSIPDKKAFWALSAENLHTTGFSGNAAAVLNTLIALPRIGWVSESLSAIINKCVIRDLYGLPLKQISFSDLVTGVSLIEAKLKASSVTRAFLSIITAF